MAKDKEKKKADGEKPDIEEVVAEAVDEAGEALKEEAEGVTLTKGAKAKFIFVPRRKLKNSKRRQRRPLAMHSVFRQSSTITANAIKACGRTALTTAFAKQ